MSRQPNALTDINLLTSPKVRTSSESRPINRAAANLLSSARLVDRETVQAINSEFYTRDLSSMHQSLAHMPEDRLPSQDILPWLHHAPRDHMDAFTDWHNDRTSLLQNHLDRDFNDLQDKAFADLERLVRVCGLHSIDTVDRLYHGLNSIEFKALGPLESQGSLGYFNGEVIGMANSYEDPFNIEGIGDTLRDTTFHEDMHIVGYLDSFLGEFVAEHSTAVNTAVEMDEGSGYPEIMCPTEREDLGLPGGVYELIREVVGQLSKRAGVTIDQYCEAYAEGKGGATQKELYKKLGTVLDEIRGEPHSLGKLLKQYKLRQSQTRRTELLYSVLQSIHLSDTTSQLGGHAIGLFSHPDYTATNSPLILIQ